MDRVTILTDRFDRALLYATHVHGGQVRKGTSTPYVAHLLAVSATVLEYGGDEDWAIAGLLHDSVEDQGGKARLEDVRNRFCDRVARVVAACSDSLADTAKGERKADWQKRKKVLSRASPTPPMRMFSASRSRTRSTMPVQSFAICESPMLAKASAPVSASLVRKRSGTIAALPTEFRERWPGQLANELHEIVEVLED